MADRAPQDPLGASRVPSAQEARELARDLLAGEGTRLAHVLTAGTVAARIAVLFEGEEADLLVAAATLHDIGYSPRLARTGFHPVDGATFLRSEGYSERLARLVAHHSLASMTADDLTRRALSHGFPRERGPLADALAYADMHSAPDGRTIPAQVRLTDIAARHGTRDDHARVGQLRAALVRVGVALEAHHQRLAP
jgi:hypothetical protein